MIRLHFVRSQLDAFIDFLMREVTELDEVPEILKNFTEPCNGRSTRYRILNRGHPTAASSDVNDRPCQCISIK